MKSQIGTLIIALLLVSLPFQPLNGQSPVKKTFNWTSFGLGLFFDDTYTRPTDTQNGISLYLRTDWQMISKIETPQGIKERNNNLAIRFINHFQNIHESKILRHYDLGLLYGKTLGTVLQLNFSGGIGIIGGKYEETIYPDLSKPNPGGITYVDKSYIGFNVPFEAGLSIVPAKKFGIGFSAFANLNSQKSINGFVLKLEFGERR
jgi:hypothetical protein